MMRKKSTYLLAVFIVSVLLSGSGIGVGPAQLRLFDISISLLVVGFVVSGNQLVFYRDSLTVYVVFGGILLYVLLLFPIQEFSIIASLLQLIELTEYLIVFAVLSSFLADGSVRDFKFILDTVLFVTVVGSLISVGAFVALGVRPVTQWYVFGLPAFGVFYAMARYVQTKDIVFVPVLLLLVVRVMIGQSRSVYIFLPLAGAIALVVSRKSSVSPRAFLRRDIVGGAVASLLPVLGGWIFLPEIRARASSIFQLSSGFLNRPGRWLAGFDVFKQYPLGVGLGNYATAVQRTASEGVITYPQWFVNIYGSDRTARQITKFQSGSAGPHSDFFRLLVELGPVGAILLVVFWLFLMKRVLTYPTDPVAIALNATIIYFVGQQMVNSQLFTGAGGVLVIIFVALFVTFQTTDSDDRNRVFG